jgi:ribosome-binding protein aMBF1 (putative translation factor)
MTQDNNNPTDGHQHMFQGNWKCSMCGAEITELPFQPDAEGSNPPVCKKCEEMKKQQAQANS